MDPRNTRKDAKETRRIFDGQLKALNYAKKENRRFLRRSGGCRASSIATAEGYERCEGEDPRKTLKDTETSQAGGASASWIREIRERTRKERARIFDGQLKALNDAKKENRRFPRKGAGCTRI
jgi:hypothetical protein